MAPKWTSTPRPPEKVVIRRRDRLPSPACYIVLLTRLEQTLPLRHFHFARAAERLLGVPGTVASRPYIWGRGFRSGPAFCGFCFTSFVFRANNAVNLLGMLASAFAFAPEGEAGSGGVQCVAQCLRQIKRRILLASPRRQDA